MPVANCLSDMHDISGPDLSTTLLLTGDTAVVPIQVGHVGTFTILNKLRP